MSDKDEAELWKQMDADFQRALQDDKDAGAHGQVTREELVRHMREDHRIAAETRLTLGEATSDGRRPVGHKVLELEEIGEARLRASHWRLHELGIEHRSTEAHR